MLSGALTRTGWQRLSDTGLMRLAGRGEAMMVTVIMVGSAVMSSVMNNVAVAALMLAGSDGYVPRDRPSAVKALDAAGIRHLSGRSHHVDRNATQHSGQQCAPR